MHFSRPIFLLVFLILPAVIWTGWPSRGARRRRLIWSLVIRSILLGALILAAAGLAIERQSEQLAVVFVVDVSDSVGQEAAREALTIIQEAARAARPDDQLAVIVFGRDTLIEKSLSDSRAIDRLLSVPDGSHTDLEEAIRLAQAIIPNDRAGRLVIFSDFLESRGDGKQAASAAAYAGLDLVLYPTERLTGEEILLAEVRSPRDALQGETIDLEVTTWSSVDQPVSIEIFSDELAPIRVAVNAAAGRSVFLIPVPALRAGFTRYTVQITAPEDGYPQNNRGSAFTFISGGPQILVVVPQPGELMPAGTSSRPNEFGALVAALEAGQFQVEVRPPGGAPSTAAELAGYSAVVLVDVPARRLASAQMAALKTYVQELGGGLALVGGPTSFGIGGYFDTPLEELAPVAMEIQDEERRSALSIVFIIDKSGSMADRTAGFSKLDLAREATLRSIRLLLPNDRLGVVVFDETASWAFPLQPVGDGVEARQALAGLSADGGTDILAGLAAMAGSLPDDPSLVKHVVLLTDGGADPTGILPLAERMNQEHGITISAVGVGSDAAPYLPEIALGGGGRYHFADHPSAIPSIFTEETVLASRAYLVEESFFPTQAGLSPILSGIRALPPLHGYVATSPKQVARLILAAENGDPILATWRFGLGKALAFTSDASGRWAQDWVVWEQFGTFWNQAIRWVLRTPSASRVQVDVRESDELQLLEVNATDEEGAYLNDFTFSARIIAPDQSVSSVLLSQIGPGQYSGTFEATQDGAYLFQIEGQAGEAGGSLIQELVGWVRDYPAEYRIGPSETDAVEPFLFESAARPAPATAASLFDHDLPAPATRVPLQTWLLLAASVLLPIDIAVRRLKIDGAWLAVFLRDRWALRSNRQGHTPGRESAPHIEALRQAKSRITDDHITSPAGPDDPPLDTDLQVPEAQAASAAESDAEEHAMPTANPTSTAAQLLARKRAREE